MAGVGVWLGVDVRISFSRGGPDEEQSECQCNGVEHPSVDVYVMQMVLTCLSG